MSSHQLSLQATLPAAPTTQRASPVRMDAFENTIAYGSGKCIIIRTLSSSGAAPNSQSGDVIVCALHRAAVTAVRFSPNGALVASGDQNGNLIIFANKPGTAERYNGGQLQGPVRDICWTGDGERLIVAGEGRTTFAVAISNTGNSIGLINGHTRNITSCDMRPGRPFRAFTGSADSFVGLYEGAPFVFNKNTAGHTGTVNCVRYSQAADEVATCSSAADLMIFDGTTGELKRSISTGHTGTIYSLAWSPDGLSIATASADKTLRILAAADGSVSRAVCLGTAVADMQQGVVWTKSAGVASVSLKGTLTVVDETSGKVSGAEAGHQGRVFHLHACSTSGDLVSVSAEGKCLRWSGASWAANATVKLPASADVVSAAASSGGGVYLVAGNQVLRYDAATSPSPGAAASVLSLSNGGFARAIAVTARGDVVLVTRAKLIVLYASGEKCTEEPLPAAFDASTAAAHGDLVAVGGDRGVRVFRVEASGTIMPTGVELTDRHTGSVTAVAFSPDGSLVASADSTSRGIYVWSPLTGEIAVNRPMCHHSAAVTGMCFDPTGRRLITGGLDCTVIAWDLDAGSRKMEDAAHAGGVTAVAWGAKGQLVSAGGDCCIRKWSA